MHHEDSEDTVIRRRHRRVDDGGVEDDTVIRRARDAGAADEPPRAVTATPGPFALVEPSAPRHSAERPATPAKPAAAPTLERFRRVRVNSREPISLETPALIGRNPVAPRIGGGSAQILVTVPSPLREVSATHIELRQHGASVVVTDLNSTNGTLVAIPGATPVKLRQGESAVLSVGSVVNIGDGNVIEVLPLRYGSNPNLP